MVDFSEIRNKAEGFASQHDDQIKQGIGKLGDFLGNKFGHDKVDPIESKLSGFIDSLGDDKSADQGPEQSAEKPTPPTAATPPTPPTAATPPTTEQPR